MSRVFQLQHSRNNQSSSFTPIITIPVLLDMRGSSLWTSASRCLVKAERERDMTVYLSCLILPVTSGVEWPTPNTVHFQIIEMLWLRFFSCSHTSVFPPKLKIRLDPGRGRWFISGLGIDRNVVCLGRRRKSAVPYTIIEIPLGFFSFIWKRISCSTQYHWCFLPVSVLGVKTPFNVRFLLHGVWTDVWWPWVI